jgi:hypothetical protein
MFHVEHYGFIGEFIEKELGVCLCKNIGIFPKKFAQNGIEK